jgi:hypothetical protein
MTCEVVYLLAEFPSAGQAGGFHQVQPTAALFLELGLLGLDLPLLGSWLVGLDHRGHRFELRPGLHIGQDPSALAHRLWL